MKTPNQSSASRSLGSGRPATAWSPLRLPLFRALWAASVVSNIGTWVHNTAAAWLMTSLSMSPLLISLVQTATTLPIFLLALPSGALADVLDRRRLILFTQIWMLVSALGLGLLTLSGHVTPWLLLFLTFALSIGSALNAPAWQAIIPELAPGDDLHGAIALNSAGFNIARAIGPALGGLLVGAAGTASAFLVNSASFLGVVWTISRWRRTPRESRLPAEHIVGAMRAGMRYVRHAPVLASVLVRGAAFIVCANALMALLPTLARHELGLDSIGYGLLLGSFGAGAVAGALVLPRVRQKASLDLLVAGASTLFAASLTCLALVKNIFLLHIAVALGGGAWLVVLSSLNASVQATAPSWVLGRALSIHLLVIFGGMAVGSAFWGAAASFTSVRSAYLVAAGGMIVGLATGFRYRLASVGKLDLTPSMHWEEPVTVMKPRPDEGPVLVTVEYFVNPVRAPEFMDAMERLRRVRLRDGAIRWEIFVDSNDPTRFMELFVVDSWMEHLRQHERITVEDRKVEDLVRSFHLIDAPPRITHLLAKKFPLKM